MRNALLLAGVLVLLLTGCAPKVAKKDNLVFFPPAPNPPRVQYLMGIGDSRDVEGKDTEYSLFSMEASKGDDVKFFVKPYGIATHGDKIYVSDTLAGKVAVIDVKQKTFDWLKGGFGPGKLKKPINMATDKEGNLFVADTIRKKIVMFDPEGNFLKVYGDAYDMKPVDVAADDRNVYALDLSRSKILVFNKNTGKLVEGLGQDSSDPKENLSLPTNMALTDHGLFYVTNITTGLIVQLDRDGHTIGTIGKMGDGFGQFGRPKGIATDSDGRVYAVDSAHQNVQIFDKSGRLLMFFGDPGLPVGSMNLPAGIAVTNENIETFQAMAAPGFELEQVVMVVNQVGQHRVGIYGLGKKKDFDYEAFYKESQEMLKKADESRAERKQDNQAKE